MKECIYSSYFKQEILKECNKNYDCDNCKRHDEINKILEVVAENYIKENLKNSLTNKQPNIE